VEVGISGTGFQAGATVTFDGPATNVRVVSDTFILVTVPPHTAGAVDVVVTNPGGQTARLAGAYTYMPLAIASVTPSSGLPSDRIRIAGTGFAPGATVTLAGLQATNATITPTSISVTLVKMPQVSEPVDVVVTNPGGQTATLARGFSYDRVTLTVSPESGSTGEIFTVSWAGVTSLRIDDWVGLFLPGDVNTSYLSYEYTNGRQSGAVTFRAQQPGQYQFRYLLNDGYDDAARSAIVTVR
jgi:hypothetical protein